VRKGLAHLLATEAVVEVPSTAPVSPGAGGAVEVDPLPVRTSLGRRANPVRVCIAIGPLRGRQTVSGCSIVSDIETIAASGLECREFGGVPGIVLEADVSKGVRATAYCECAVWRPCVAWVENIEAGYCASSVHCERYCDKGRNYGQGC